MKKTNLIILALFAIGGSIAAWYLTTKEDANLEGYDFHFAIKDTSNIGKIFLADRFGKTTTLTRQNSVNWLVSGKYPVQADMIKNLLETLSQVELKFRLPRNAVKSVVQDMATEGIKVEVYDRKGKPVRVFYVGGSTSDDRGTFMMMENSNEPYVMHISGHQTVLRPRFLTAAQDWRERFVFKLPQIVDFIGYFFIFHLFLHVTPLALDVFDERCRFLNRFVEFQTQCVLRVDLD